MLENVFHSFVVNLTATTSSFVNITCISMKYFSVNENSKVMRKFLKHFSELINKGTGAISNVHIHDKTLKPMCAKSVIIIIK